MKTFEMMRTQIEEKTGGNVFDANYEFFNGITTFMRITVDKVEFESLNIEGFGSITPKLVQKGNDASIQVNIELEKSFVKHLEKGTEFTDMKFDAPQLSKLAEGLKYNYYEEGMANLTMQYMFGHIQMELEATDDDLVVVEAGSLIIFTIFRKNGKIEKVNATPTQRLKESAKNDTIVALARTGKLKA